MTPAQLQAAVSAARLHHRDLSAAVAAAGDQLHAASRSTVTGDNDRAGEIRAALAGGAARFGEALREAAAAVKAADAAYRRRDLFAARPPREPAERPVPTIALVRADLCELIRQAHVLHWQLGLVEQAPEPVQARALPGESLDALHALTGQMMTTLLLHLHETGDGLAEPAGALVPVAEALPMPGGGVDVRRYTFRQAEDGSQFCLRLEGAVGTDLEALRRRALREAQKYVAGRDGDCEVTEDPFAPAVELTWTRKG